MRARPRHFDALGLRHGLADRILPFLVAAMTFLAALALTGFIAATTLARHWQEGAGANLTVQVPRPAAPAPSQDATRQELALAILAATPGIAEARALTNAQLADLLRPWLGEAGQDLALPLPAVIRVRLGAEGPGRLDLDALTRRLRQAVPGVLVESHRFWLDRLGALARSLQACAATAMLLVAGVSAAVITVATRAGLAARRQAIEIVHGLGATDFYIATRFARRATWLATLGGTLGAAAALPVLLGLAHLAAPLSGAQGDAGMGFDLRQGLPTPLWLGLGVLPALAAAIGFATAHLTVRGWLRRLP